MNYEILDGFDISVEVTGYNRDFARQVFNSVRTTWCVEIKGDYDPSDEKVIAFVNGVNDRQLNPALLELGTVQLLVKGMTRVGMAQITRQRSATFNVASQASNLTETTMRFVRPRNFEDRDRFAEFVETSVKYYYDLVSQGMPPQEARYILPQTIECGDISWNTTASQIANIAAFRLCNTCSPDENNLVIRQYLKSFRQKLLADLGSGSIDSLTFKLYESILDRTDCVGAKNDTFCSFNSVFENSKRFTKVADEPKSIKNIKKYVKLNYIDFKRGYFSKELKTGKYSLFKGEEAMLKERSIFE